MSHALSSAKVGASVGESPKVRYSQFSAPLVVPKSAPYQQPTLRQPEVKEQTADANRKSQISSDRERTLLSGRSSRAPKSFMASLAIPHQAKISDVNKIDNGTSGNAPKQSRDSVTRHSQMNDLFAKQKKAAQNKRDFIEKEALERAAKQKAAGEELDSQPAEKKSKSFFNKDKYQILEAVDQKWIKENLKCV